MSTAQPRPKRDDLDSVYVFHGRPLRPGTDLADTAQFKDDVWQLSPATLQGHGRGLALRFNTIPTRHQRTVKLLCYGFLSGPLPPNEIQQSVSSVSTNFYRLRVFLRWLSTEYPDLDVGQVDLPILQEYLQYTIIRFRAPSEAHGHRAAVRMLWRYRLSLENNPLRADPQLIDGWVGPYARRTENSTSRIPEEVHSRVLVWALRFVNDFSEDIFIAINAWDRIRDTHRLPDGAPFAARFELPGKLDCYLQIRIDEGKPLPGYNGQPSILSIARNAGCTRETVVRHFADVESAAAAVGVSDYACLDVQLRGRIDGQPWLEGVSLDPVADDSLTVLTQMLQAACYIVVAFLSGMRDAEVKHLRAGCATTIRDGNHTPYRWKVNSLAFKGENDDAGVPATWIVGESAAQAIAVLERVHQERGQHRTDWLLAPIKCGPGVGSTGRNGNLAMTAAGTNRQLNRFVTWINDYCAANGRADGIPDVDGERWRLSTRQFRRTLAWYIARRPGGVIAGAIAYRHHSVQMFEGYAGTSDSGFRAEVEAEEALARGEHLLAMVDRHEHNGLVGPAAADAHRRLNEFDLATSFPGRVVTDRQRLLRILNKHDPAVYPGRYVTCVYDHTKALCRAKNGTDSSPDLSGCKPLSCGNVALSSSNVDAWNAELSAIDSDLSLGGPLPPLLHTQLEQRRDHISSFLARQGAPK
ncbi:hypothetical protein [Mycobacterium sp. OTB74]|uniref:hypothetical protein n=1 Tax=Mycobacterium sp. OTB74 TaxID=1853452 RepID=UPI002475D0B4|nr:hypothetical protein [Mycobacterium sp. OTB74]MDH6245067.1 hypothetical protein [Mycobacterium sp. OTB74]